MLQNKIKLTFIMNVSNVSKEAIIFALWPLTCILNLGYKSSFKISILLILHMNIISMF